MAPQRSISELSSLVHSHVSAIEDAMDGSAQFSLSFGVDPPMVKLPGSLEAAHAELLETIDELRARILGPIGYFTQLALPLPVKTAFLHTLYAFDIPSHVPLGPDASISYQDLAERCGLPVEVTRRVVRTAIAHRIFEEAEPGVSVKHNAVSAIVVAVPGVKDYLGLMAEDTTPGSLKFVESLRRYPDSGEPGHAANMVAARMEAAAAAGVKAEEPADPSRGFFDFISTDAGRVARFRTAMGLSNNMPAFSSSYFVDALPWSGEGADCPGTVVDVGGAGGELCHKLLRRHAGVRRAVVLDLPEVVAGVEVPRDLEGRLEFAAYDFLAGGDAVVRPAADAFVLRHIFHDWSDQYAARILRNLVPALREGTRIWLCEGVLDELDERRHVRDQLQRSADLLMKVGFNGKERSRQDWEELFAQVDSRFRVVRVVRPEGAHDALIEVAFGS